MTIQDDQPHAPPARISVGFPETSWPSKNPKLAPAITPLQVGLIS
jgi:hypothetical protein